MANSAVAARKGNADIAVGNVVGSNIFNILFILGIRAVVQPLTFRAGSNMDTETTLLATILLFIFMFTGRHHAMDRREGLLCIALYVTYLGVLFRFIM